MTFVLPFKQPRWDTDLEPRRDDGKTVLTSGQTRRRLGGRHPLCGMGVTSRMSVTLRPLFAIARRADSRPAPGPFTRTSSAFMPWSCALRQASSAATCAANGVDLREPLKPRAPQVDHATVP